jgi:protein-S-isoprenylcysteine O-methyltransferase Ste14
MELGRNRWLGRVRLVALYAGAATMLFAARPRFLDVALGGLLVLGGEALRVWAAGHLVKNDRLVTSGPYRYTRNPLYLGRLLIFAGLCVMTRLPHGASWAVLAAGLVLFFAYYLPRKERIEPARLRALHGEPYERYRREVPPLWPALHPWGSASADRWSSARALGLREHWLVAALLLILAFLLSRALQL